MGGSASSSPAVQRSLANFMDAMSGGLNSQPAIDQYSKQFRNMPDAAIRGVGDAVASIPDMAIAAGKLAMEGGFNPRMGQSERVKRFADTTYMPINPMMQDALTRAGVAETEGGNNLTRFVSGAMAPYALGKYAGAVGDAVGAAERGALGNAERGMVKLTDDLPMDEASRMARADEMFPIDAYTGTQRLDRLLEKPGIDQSRATSGPMPYFTDEKPLASSYAIGKQDTSLEHADYGDWFKYKSPVTGTERPIHKSWNLLPPNEQKRISDELGKIGYIDEDHTIIGKTNDNVAGAGSDHWQYTLKSNKGNALAAAKDLWLDSGNLFGREDEFKKVLDLAGVKNVTLDNPNAVAPGILPARLRMEKPFETTPENVSSLLDDFRKAQQPAKYSGGVDGWDKNGPRGAAFVSQLEADLKNGTTFAWTSIPDWATEVLKKKGFDGIKDIGGKNGGPTHTVYIPFSPSQVRSRFAKFDPKKRDSSDLLAAGLPLSAFVGERDDTPYDRLKRKFKGAK